MEATERKWANGSRARSKAKAGSAAAVAARCRRITITGPPLRNGVAQRESRCLNTLRTLTTTASQYLYSHASWHGRPPVWQPTAPTDAPVGTGEGAGQSRGSTLKNLGRGGNSFRIPPLDFLPCAHRQTPCATRRNRPLLYPDTAAFYPPVAPAHYPPPVTSVSATSLHSACSASHHDSSPPSHLNLP